MQHFEFGKVAKWFIREWINCVMSPEIPHNLLSKPLTTFPHNRCQKKMVTDEIGVNPVAVTMINLQKKIGRVSY